MTDLVMTRLSIDLRGKKQMTHDMVLSGTRVLVSVIYQNLQGDGMESRVQQLLAARAVIRHVTAAFVPWLAGREMLVKSEVSAFGTALDEQLMAHPDFKTWAIMGITFEGELAPHIRVQQLTTKK